MALADRPVIVKQLPAVFDKKDEQAFLSALESEIAQLVRPSVVLDCSRVRRMDKDTLHLLLCCLETAMKRNGDARLAAVAAEAWPILESTGLRRLFRIFPSAAEAMNSFRRPAPGPAPQCSASAAPDQPAAHAA